MSCNNTQTNVRSVRKVDIAAILCMFMGGSCLGLKSRERPACWFKVSKP